MMPFSYGQPSTAAAFFQEPTTCGRRRLPPTPAEMAAAAAVAQGRPPIGGPMDHPNLRHLGPPEIRQRAGSTVSPTRQLPPDLNLTRKMSSLEMSDHIISKSPQQQVSPLVARRNAPLPSPQKNLVPEESLLTRRASSPRMLPTPPSPLQNGHPPPSPNILTPSPPIPVLERKFSGRRLPREPIQMPQRGLDAQLILSPSPAMDANGYLMPKSPSRNGFHQLPLTPDDIKSGVQLNGYSQEKVVRKESTLQHRSSQNRLIPPEPIAIQQPQPQSPRQLPSSPQSPYHISSSMPPTPNQLPVSAPQSPRNRDCDSAASDTLIKDSLRTSSPIQTQRKFSCISTDASSLLRNGSMAHLLEQQHILRKEFNTTPDSARHSNSNTSSTSPSMEQISSVNRSQSSSDVEDPSTHGLDPSLYGAVAPTTSASSYSVPETSALNGHSKDNGSASGATTPVGATVTTSNSWPENEPRPKGLGLIHCTLQHFPVRKRLRVSVLKIEGLAGELKPELEIVPFCKVNIVPGKKNTQQVSFVKRGRDAVFNQEFFFDNIPTEEIESKQLSIEVWHQANQKLQKDVLIGEICVPLKDLTQLYTKKEVRIVEELKYRMSSKKLGKISITTCIEKEAKRLTINLLRVDDLPKWGFMGAPDVCVRITLSQSNNAPTTKSSRILKNTCTAVYKEAIMFLISTKEVDLIRTKITINVHDLSRSATGDDVIGSAYLGDIAVDKSEIDQWRNTVDHWGKEYKACHNLKSQNQNAPDVHVSETQSDSEE